MNVYFISLKIINYLLLFIPGGPLTVTDANLILGRIKPEYFPKIFGPNENEPLDIETTRSKFEELRKVINEFLIGNGQRDEPLTIEEVAMGFIRVANESMCRPIRALTQSRGLDTSKHVLACFGGAGAQHACSIARELGMSEIFVHKYAGILSAYGMALADVVHEAQEPSGLEYCKENIEAIKSRLDALCRECETKLKEHGFDIEHIALEPYLHLRYESTDTALMCTPETKKKSQDCIFIPNYGDFYVTFLNRYETEFGFVISGRRVIVDDIRVRGCGKTNAPKEKLLRSTSNSNNIKINDFTNVYFEGLGPTHVSIILYSELQYGHLIPGPVLLIDNLSTIVVEPNCRAEVTPTGNLIIHIEPDENSAQKLIDDKLDAVQLSIFSHRFMSIAEQMGRILQRTSISTNIKERLDFSCALFGPDGGLVSNAPHIPVHLGAMQETVQYQLKDRSDRIKPGDVILSNHPDAGGSHLPDMTVITPVFYK